VIASPAFSGNVFDGNGFTALGLIGGNLAQSGTLPVRDVAGHNNITYVLDSNLTILFGATLTVEPGVVIKCYYQRTYDPYEIGNLIYVRGGLIAEGDSLNPIVFTSIRDDAYGNPGDTNGDGVATTPAPGNWYRIEFTDTSVDSLCRMNHCVVRYGNYYYYTYGSSHYGSVRVTSASPTFSNCTFEHAYFYGLMLDGVSEPVIQDCQFVENGSTPLALTLLSDPVMSGNEFFNNGYDALGIIGETLAQDATWKRRDVAQKQNIPYVLLTDLTVGTGASLTLEPGLIIKFAKNPIDREQYYPYYTVQLRVRRSLLAEGKADPESMIVFTSTSDDFYGGDTNGDSTDTDGSSSRWGWIEVESTAMSQNVRFSNCVFSHTYESPSYGAVVVKGSVSPTFDHCIFAHNAVGINYQEASGDSAIGKVDSCDFFDHSYYGIKNTGAAQVIWAKGCWWGHNTGPYDPSDDTGSGGFYNPAGLGDPVTDMVDYLPWGSTGVQNYLLGDVSLNGKIRAWDASLILRWLVADTTLTPRQQTIGDVTCAAGLSALDASYILQYVAGLISFFPCECESTPTFRMLASEEWPGLTPGDFEIRIEDFSLAPGSRIALPVLISGSGDIYASEFELEANSEKVTLIGVTPGDAMDGEYFYSSIGEDGVARIACAATGPVPMGVTAEIMIAVDEDIGEDDEVMISFRRARINEQDLTQNARGARGISPEHPPIAYALHQNMPNPFGASTTIRFAIPSTAAGNVNTTVRVYSINGRLVKTLCDRALSAGIHEVSWDGKDERGTPVGSGVYACRLEAGGFSAKRKMILLR
jgi:hypothetical protein